LTTIEVLLAGRRVLVVEDDSHVAEALVTVLKAYGVEIVGPAGTATDALALIFEGERIDGAVLDVSLHGEFVYPVAEVLGAKGVPFVFTTGYDERSIASNFADIPCLQKPVAIERLAQALFG